jgi:hypothetical protein
LRQRLVERSPDLAQTLDANCRKAVVAHAVERAKTYGFTNRGSIRLYFDLCVIFGSSFVDDPVYPWAVKTIGDSDPGTQMERAELLYLKSLVAIDEISGPEDAYAISALRALSTWAPQPLELQGAKLEDFAVWQMRWLHIEKANHAGEEALRLLFHQAEAVCQDYKVTEPRAIILTTALKFAFGAGCLTDPLYGWIGATLAQEKAPDAAVRFERLERKALTWLNAVLSKQL